MWRPAPEIRVLAQDLHRKGNARLASDVLDDEGCV
jgi:hypothetical protein